ncbi:MAG: DUF3572 domain-containing protein [Hyphomicrobiales bacterium]
MQPASIEEAEAISIQALTYFAQDPESLERFLSLSGITADRIREAAKSPGFLAGVLDYLMQNESLLLTFSENTGVRAETIISAHRQLVGYDIS